VHCTSTFTLLFRIAFQGQEQHQIRLSLEPNHDLFPEGVVEYIDDEGRTTRTEQIKRHEHKVYKGEAYVRDEQTKSWRHCGWARITILRDGEKPLFEGVFIQDGETNHVKLLSDFNAGRDEGDVEFGENYSEDTIVIYRDSDRFVSQAALLARAVDGFDTAENANRSMCAHDRLAFNMQERGSSFTSAWDLFGRLRRRQSDVGGGIATGGSRSQLATTIGNTNGCSTTRQVALVAAAADCSYVSHFGNASAARSHIISIYNQVGQSVIWANIRHLQFMKISSISPLDSAISSCQMPTVPQRHLQALPGTLLAIQVLVWTMISVHSVPGVVNAAMMVLPCGHYLLDALPVLKSGWPGSECYVNTRRNRKAARLSVERMLSAIFKMIGKSLRMSLGTDLEHIMTALLRSALQRKSVVL
jgi:hypothetical protein